MPRPRVINQARIIAYPYSIPTPAASTSTSPRAQDPAPDTTATSPNQDASENVAYSLLHRTSRYRPDKVVLYVNGDLEINGVVMVTIDQPTLDRIRQIHGSRKIKLDRNGYPSIGGKLIHNLLMQGGEEAARILWIAKGWDGVGPMEICHLNDNPHDFNVENLQICPRRVNQWCKKRNTTISYETDLGPRHISQVNFNNNITGSRAFQTESEAFFAYDCMKMKLIVDNESWCADFVFAYGLKRVRGRDAEYTTIQTLIAQHGSVIPQPRPPLNLQPRSMRFRVLDQPQFYSPIINETIEASKVPIDAAKHAVVQYTGKGKSKLTGEAKEIQFVVDKSFYNSTIKDYTGAFSEQNGYVCVGKDRLHLLVLGRKIGESYDDKLQGCHGPGGKLDNRLEMLRMGSAGDNQSDQSASTNTSSHVGISYIAREKKWQAQITISSLYYIIGKYETHDDAVTARNKITNNLAKIKEKLQDCIDTKTKRALVRNYANE